MAETYKGQSQIGEEQLALAFAGMAALVLLLVIWGPAAVIGGSVFTLAGLLGKIAGLTTLGGVLFGTINVLGLDMMVNNP